MKKFLLPLAALFIFKSAVAQIAFNRSQQFKTESPGNVLEVINGCYYFSSTVYEAVGFGTSSLYKYDKIGNLQFKIGVYGTPVRGFKTLDNKLLLISREPICDVMPQELVYFISKIDTAGTILFSDTCKGWNALLQLPDSTFRGFANTTMFSYSKSGQPTYSVNTGVTGILSSILLPNNNILVSGSQGFTEISPSGTIVSAHTAPPLSKMQWYGGQKIIGTKSWWGTGMTLCKFSPGLSFIDSLSFGSITGIRDFICDKDTIYSLLGTYGPNSYKVMDTAFVSIASYTISTSDVTHTALVKNHGMIGILSGYGVASGVLFGQRTYGTDLHVMNKLSGNQFKEDLAVLSYAIDSSYILNGYVYLRANVKVKNKGTSPIERFMLNCYLNPRIDCGSYYFQQLIAHQHLLPGDSMVVTTSFISKPIYYYGNSSNVPFCIYSTLPNGEADKTYEDNEVCHNFDMVSLSEFSLRDNSSIYPNPFAETLTIEAEAEIKSLEMIDCTGKLIHRSEINKNSAKISAAELEQGLYILKIVSENGIEMKKVIKN